MTWIQEIVPEEKDLFRARNLYLRKKCKNPSGTPLQSKADSMAKLITDKYKLVRRAKAMVSYWGTDTIAGTVNDVQVEVNVWAPFKQRLEELGFNSNEIECIANYEHGDVFEQLGLEDLLL